MFNGEINSYTIGLRPTCSLDSEMLEKAFERLPEKHKCMIYSDQGWHYLMKPYRKALGKREITQSMSRKSSCYDNLVMENFLNCKIGIGMNGEGENLDPLSLSSVFISRYHSDFSKVVIEKLSQKLRESRFCSNSLFILNR